MLDACLTAMRLACPTHARRICTYGRTDGLTYDLLTNPYLSPSERARVGTPK